MDGNNITHRESEIFIHDSRQQNIKDGVKVSTLYLSGFLEDYDDFVCLLLKIEFKLISLTFVPPSSPFSHTLSLSIRLYKCVYICAFSLSEVRG
jgi:hypothetical protein